MPCSDSNEAVVETRRKVWQVDCTTLSKHGRISNRKGQRTWWGIFCCYKCFSPFNFFIKRKWRGKNTISVTLSLLKLEINLSTFLTIFFSRPCTCTHTNEHKQISHMAFKNVTEKMLEQERHQKESVRAKRASVSKGATVPKPADKISNEWTRCHNNTNEDISFSHKTTF